MSTIHHALGFIHRLEKLEGKTYREQIELLEKARSSFYKSFNVSHLFLDNFEKALEANPNYKDTLINVASVFQTIWGIQEAIQKKNEFPSLFDPLIEKARQYYNQAVDADRSNAESWYKFGVFLVDCKRPEKAIDCFFQVVGTKDIGNLYYLMAFDELQQLITKDKYPKTFEVLSKELYKVHKSLK